MDRKPWIVTRPDASRAFFVFVLLLSFPVQARIVPTEEERGPTFARTKFQEGPVASDSEPVLLNADRIDYDQTQDLVLASGGVEVTQGETILIADTLAYDQPKNLVRAKGNVSMLTPTGNVYFAEELELRDDLKAGVIRQFKARLADNSLLVASAARRNDENHMELFNASYTPCECGDGQENPQWQVRADHILVDQIDQRVRYRNAYFETYGVPVIYTPMLSHATPGADNQSGLMIPEYAHSENLGSTLKVPYYYTIAADKDVTVIPIFTSKEGLVMSGQYRQLFDAGPLLLEGSVTRPSRRDALGNPTTDTETRGHIDAIGRFQLSPDSDWGFDIHRVTDDTYLRRYNFSQDTLLTSRAYAEGFGFAGDPDRAYATVEGLAFQGLTADDDPDRVPFILPLTTVVMESDPGIYNSRFRFDGNLMALYRDIGAQSRRVSAITSWNLPYITDDGQLIEFTSQLRSDVYSVNDVILPDGSEFDGTTGRLVPQVSVLWRYPFINRWQNGSVIVEPVVNLVVSPGGGNPDKIPNEDSLVPEFTDTNLFSDNRFAGLDRIESGPRVSYGVRGQAQLFSDKYINWLIGQNYRTHNDRNFPFSNDLSSHFSDYVGKLGFVYNPFDLTYRFRLDKDTLAAQRNEVEGTFRHDWFTFSTSYLMLKNDPILANKENVSASISLRLTDEWTWNLSGAEDIELEQITSAATGLVYKNECTEIISLIGREYTRDRDLEPSTNFLIKVSFKNLE